MSFQAPEVNRVSGNSPGMVRKRWAYPFSSSERMITSLPSLGAGVAVGRLGSKVAVKTPVAGGF
jgi:hypothetical protein